MAEQIFWAEYLILFESEEQWNAVARDVKYGIEIETQLHVLYETHFVC